MPGQRQSHRKMAADGASAEDAYPHERMFLPEGWGLFCASFHKLAPERNRPCEHAGCAESHGSIRDVSA